MTVTRNQRKRLVGTVVSTKMDKTITVLVERTYKHPKYGKFVRRDKRYHAHDENNEAKVGDRVELMECRPLSRLKHFRLVAITQHGVHLEPTSAEREVTGEEAEGGAA
jgi:small subunit ribosomal protein S17